MTRRAVVTSLSVVKCETIEADGGRGRREKGELDRGMNHGVRTLIENDKQFLNVTHISVNNMQFQFLLKASGTGIFVFFFFLLRPRRRAKVNRTSRNATYRIPLSLSLCKHSNVSKDVRFTIKSAIN